MELAKIIRRAAYPWRLEDDTDINPEVGTIVQFERVGCWAATYFPGYPARCTIYIGGFNLYFRELLE